MVCMFGKTPKVFTISEKKDSMGNTKNFFGIFGPKQVPENPDGYSEKWCLENMKNISKAPFWKAFYKKKSDGISLFSVEEIQQFYNDAQKVHEDQKVRANQINKAIADKVTAANRGNDPRFKADGEDKFACGLYICFAAAAICAATRFVTTGGCWG